MMKILKKAFILLLFTFAAFIITTNLHAALFVDPTSEFLISEPTATSAAFGSPQIYGDIVTWIGALSNGKQGIFYKDLAIGEQYQISEQSFERPPSIYENTIVWSNVGWTVGTEGIYSYDVLSGAMEQLVSIVPQTNPENAKTFGNNVVWHGNTGNNPDIVSGYDLTTNSVFEISTGNSVWGIDIHQDTVVWGSAGIWAKNLTTGTKWQVALDGFEPYKTVWPYHPLIHGDIAVWQAQVFYDPINNPNYTSWDLYGRNLLTGEMFAIDENPLYHSTLGGMDLFGNILLWQSSMVGDWPNTDLWATNIQTGDKFLVSNNHWGAIRAGIFDDLIVYDRNGSIYGNYIVDQPIPEPGTMLLIAFGLVGLTAFRRKNIRKRI